MNPEETKRTTRETALHLARAAVAFPFLGICEVQELLDVVRCELSHEEILDDFQPYGNYGNRENRAENHFAKAIPPRAIFHIFSGNTPHAALQSLIRGLLIGAQNFCKIPSAGLPEVAEFCGRLPSWLAARVEISREFREDWMAVSDALIVFGDDATIAHFRKLTRADQRFLAHGHKVSAGLVVRDATFESVPHAARDASLFDQRGCLSPHAFYVAENAREYASRLAAAMADFQAQSPRAKLTVSEAAAIREVREAFAFRAANGEAVEVFASVDSTDWTVIYEADPAWRASCLNRVVFVKPLTAGLDEAFAPVRPWLSTVGLWPATLENARRFASLDASRFCKIGEMQSPPFTWHQDGAPTLAELVRWVDFSS